MNVHIFKNYLTIIVLSLSLFSIALFSSGLTNQDGESPEGSGCADGRALNSGGKIIGCANGSRYSKLMPPRSCDVHLKGHNQTWDAESETYLPINEDWQTCMQLGSK